MKIKGGILKKAFIKAFIMTALAVLVLMSFSACGTVDPVITPPVTVEHNPQAIYVGLDRMYVNPVNDDWVIVEAGGADMTTVMILMYELRNGEWSYVGNDFYEPVTLNFNGDSGTLQLSFQEGWRGLEFLSTIDEDRRVLAFYANATPPPKNCEAHNYTIQWDDAAVTGEDIPVVLQVFTKDAISDDAYSVDDFFTPEKLKNSEAAYAMTLGFFTDMEIISSSQSTT